MPDYPSEQLAEIYKALPQALKTALFSEENARNIQKACLENSAEDKNLDVAKNVGYVLMGLLSPSDFLDVLENELKIDKKSASLIAREITRLVFFPQKNLLEPLYKTKMTLPQIEESQAEETISPNSAPKSPPQERISRQDTYREKIE